MSERAPARSERAPAPSTVDAAALRAALEPLLARVGGRVVEGEVRPGDVPVEWLGEVLLHVRLPAPEPVEVPDASEGIAGLIGQVETELGGSLGALARADKQRAVRMLEERGAFTYRKSAELIAEALGVSRFTVYNYLNRTAAG